MSLEYPIKFTAILKAKIWGGEKLQQVLKKKSFEKNIGESWEISGVEGDISVVANGNLAGKTLHELIKNFKGDFLGNHVYEKFGNQFPMLFKFIDAKENLSVQVHPNDEIAGKRHNSFGKTEMWYIVQADKNANLIIGFNQKVNATLYEKYLKNGLLEKILHFEKVNVGDTFYITPGRIRAIGAGVLLAEIQQSSDITYRVFDWNRRDADGNLRELHTDLAIDAIDFEETKTFKHKSSSVIYHTNTILNSPYFTISILEINKKIHRNVSEIDSFIVYMCVDGNASIQVGNYVENIAIGDTVLIPALCKEISISATFAKLLEVFVP